MDIPLVLRARGDSTLEYGIPAWYRLIMAAILALILAALFVSEGPPGILGWIFIAINLFAALYEERWTFDAKKGELRHRFGLVFAARTLRLPFASISAFRLEALVRGTLPGSQDERAENERALAESRGQQITDQLPGKRRPMYKKAYISLVCESPETKFLLNTVPARNGPKLRLAASSIADFCGKPLEEGQ
ncbi:MAG: hypothetical protein WCL50_04915 [Spirochaetota bacterium]